MRDLSDVPARYRGLRNLPSLLSLMEKDPSFNELWMAKEGIALVWRVAEHKGYEDAAKEISAELQNKHEKMSAELETFRGLWQSAESNRQKASAQQDKLQDMLQEQIVLRNSREEELRLAAQGLQAQREEIRQLSASRVPIVNRIVVSFWGKVAATADKNLRRMGTIPLWPAQETSTGQPSSDTGL